MGASSHEKIAFLWLALQVGSTITITLEDCTSYEYLLNDGTQCRTCDACPAGQRYTIHCGYQQDKNGNISKPKPSCEPCPQGTYKGDKSLSLCRDCKLECPGNMSVVRQCNGTHDLKCGRCKKGFYTEYDGTCMPCLPCLGNVFDLVFQKLFVQKECKDAGMGTKSCRPHYQKGTQATMELESTQMRPSVQRAVTMTKTTTTTKKTTSTKTTQQFVTPFPRRSGRLLDPGWFVIVAIGVIVVSAIIFFSLKHFNIVKRVKALLMPSIRPSQQDDFFDEAMVTVKERFEYPAEQRTTNYAELIPNEGENQSCMSPSQHHPPIKSRCVICAEDEEFPVLPNSEGAKAANQLETSSDDPWVYRKQTDHRQPKWPLYRPMADDAMILYGEHFELVRSREGSCGSLAAKTNAACNDETEPTCELTELSTEDMQVMGEKNVEEKSGTEELPTSVPVTVGSGTENPVVIATGKHIGGTGARELLELPNTKNGSTKKKRKKKEHSIKEPQQADCIHTDVVPGDSLECTCKCSYRPYLRDLKLCHCPKCVPHPNDDLYDIIERHCLRSEVCKELNRTGVPNWVDLSIYIRIDKQIAEMQRSVNPADVVLNMLKISRPRMQLQDFDDILKKIKRQDIVDRITNHHVNCMLCRRNSFDGSRQDVSHSDPRTGHSKIILDV